MRNFLKLICLNVLVTIPLAGITNPGDSLKSQNVILQHGQHESMHKQVQSPFLPVTIFQTTDAPDFPLEDDSQPIEVGVKFRTNQNGTISAIRYYKGSGTTGTHVGTLRTSAGSPLGVATFTSETASGWQEVSFEPAIAIEAGVTYIASCYSPSGQYASSPNYFTVAKENGPIKALADGEDGPNALYKYGTSGVPNLSHNKSNYWVDVVFNPGSGSGSGTVNGTTNYLAKFTAPNAVGNSLLFDNGTSIGIGTTNINASYKLFVETGIRTRMVKVDVATWPDYVFADKYPLATLDEVEKFIKENKHLPGVAPANEIERNGLNLGDNQAVLLKKIEELTLYIIEQNKANEQMKKIMEELKVKIQLLEEKSKR